MNILSEAVMFSFNSYPKSNSILVLELMDYPDSDEDAGGQAMGINPNILDAEDMEKWLRNLRTKRIRKAER